MANARHGDQNPTDGDGLHVLHNFEPANAAALAALAVVAADIGKVARQVDTADFYVLRSVGPSVWDKINGSGSGTGDVVGPASSIDDRLALFDGVTGKLLKQGTVTGSAVATHLPDTANPHATDIGNIGSGTLAELNVAVTDATLDDASAPRTPTAHASTHENGGGDEISVAGLSGLLADAQTPTAHAATHSNGGSDEISVEVLATAEVNAALVLKPDGAGGLVFGAVGGTGDVVGPASAVDDRLALFDGVTGKLIKQGAVTGAAVSAHLPDTANPHATDVGNLGSGTLAELNAAITDATLDDASDPRTPTAHAATHSNGGSDEIVVENLATASTTLTHVLAPDGAGGLTMRAEASGGTVWTVATETTAARSAATGEFILINAATCVITLPAPVGNARVAFKAIVVPATVTSIEIRTSGAGITIDGTDYSATGLPLAEQFEMVTVISDGSNWWIY